MRNYHLIDSNILEIKNIDLPRKVRYRRRNKSSNSYKIDKKCLESRRYEDFLEFMKENPDTTMFQMDTVEGIKGSKVLLTIHFVSSSFIFAYLRDIAIHNLLLIFLID